MSMSKKDFIALADAIKDSAATGQGQTVAEVVRWTPDHLRVLAEFCERQNSNFMPRRWFGYIRGECGKNGGKVAA